MNSEHAEALKVEVPFTYIRTQQIAVKGRLYGKTLPMLVDTGSSHTVIHTATAQDLGIPLADSSGVGGGVGGNNIAMYPLPSMAIELGKENWIVKPIAMDLSHVVHALKESRSRQVSIVLGADLLREYNALIDYGRRVMTLFSHE